MTKTPEQIIEIVYKTFHSKLVPFGECWLAGGCVRDTLLGRQPKDYDFFILNCKDSFDETKKKITEILKDFELAKMEVEWHKSEPFLVLSLILPLDGEELEIQILFNPERNIIKLLESFDWNVCLYAYGYTEIFTDPMFIYDVHPSEFVKVGGELKLNKITYPLSSLRRGYRFSERFLMKLSRDDIYWLCEEILKLEDSNKEENPPENGLVIKNN